jgi:hypothetical protein
MKFFFSRSNSAGFRARSAERDQSTDEETVVPIKTAIDQALSRAENEYNGLKTRLDSVTASAVFVAGTEADEYLERDAKDTDRLREYESEMKRANARLQQLTDMIAHLKFIRAAFKTRFPQI